MIKTITFRIIFFILLIFNILVVSGPNAQTLFEVEKESFCREVINNKPVNVLSGIAQIKRGDGIFFWIEIRAEKRALRMLETKCEFPIFHAWASKIGVIDIINVGIKKDAWIKNREIIRTELKARGIFTWRTQSFKRNFQEGIYYVSILDANKRPVRKTGAGNEVLRPEINIRFLP